MQLESFSRKRKSLAVECKRTFVAIVRSLVIFIIASFIMIVGQNNTFAWQDYKIFAGAVVYDSKFVHRNDIETKPLEAFIKKAFSDTFTYEMCIRDRFIRL